MRIDTSLKDVLEVFWLRVLPIEQASEMDVLEGGTTRQHGQPMRAILEQETPSHVAEIEQACGHRERRRSIIAHGISPSVATHTCASGRLAFRVALVPGSCPK